MQPRRVNFHTLGCKLNFSESSTLARMFEQGGFVRVAPSAPADICVINTCSVTEHADKKCRNMIRRLHRLNPNAIIAVTGCYAQLRPQEIADIEGVDLVLGNNDKGALYDRVVALAGKGRAQIYSCDTDDITNFFAAFSSGDRTRAFLKVQDGCDYCCSYCTIHYARGSSRNIPIAEVVEQARRIAAGGQREIVLTGVNTGDFGRTTGERFIDLLVALDGVEGIDRYRISSIEPNLLTDEIVDFCARSPRFQPHFHIPLQSGSDKILQAMGRRYLTSGYADHLNRIRAAMSDAFIGIDVIVGFPGEGEREFMETYEFLERVRPAFIHIFPFSERPGTPAVKLPGKVPPEVAAERVGRLEALCHHLHREFYAAQIGRTAGVLFESTVRGGMMSGFTENYCRVRMPLDRSRINTVARVRLTAIDPSGELTGEYVE